MQIASLEIDDHQKNVYKTNQSNLKILIKSIDILQTPHKPKTFESTNKKINQN